MAGMALSAAPGAAPLIDVVVESVRIASDLLRDATHELAHEELDPRADDLTIAVARQRVFLARRRLLAARHVLGYEDDLACECC